MKKMFKLTQEGIDELKAEMQTLISRRSAVAEAIKSAREQGDLSENAEYEAAKLEQGRDESRIAEIEHILLNTEVIKKPKGDSKVQLGSVVILKNEAGKEKKFQVVGTVEADPLNGKVSDESPIGKALLGNAVGSKVIIKTPTEDLEYKIIDIA